MSRSAPDIEIPDCPSHEACGGWCKTHQVITDADVAHLRDQLKKMTEKVPLDLSDDVLASVQSIVRERLYLAWDAGYLAGREAPFAGVAEEPENPYAWTGWKP